MLIAKGLGYLILPLGFTIPVSIQVLVTRLWGPAAYRAHDRPLAATGYALSALLLWYLGRRFNGRPPVGEWKALTTSKHHVFLIRLEYWAIPFALLAVFVAIPWEIMPFYQRPAGADFIDSVMSE